MSSMKQFLLFFALFLSAACSTETEVMEIPDVPETKGMITIEVTEQMGEAADKMESIRFFIFNNTGTSTKPELNEYFKIPASSPDDKEISKFKITLETSMQPGKENNKIIIAIINEPSTQTHALEAISEYAQLTGMELDFGDFLNSQHTGLQNNKTMPMAGVVWTNKVYSTEAQAAANPVQMRVWRAPARIEIYLRKEAGLDFKLDSGTEITLGNTYDKEYFIYYASGTHTFGQIQTVTSGFLDKKWMLGDNEEKEIPVISNDNQGRLVCLFYTPERTSSAAHNADKLHLTIQVRTNEGSTRHAEVVIDNFTTGKEVKPVDIVSRNTIYRVIATIGTESITVMVRDWNDEDIETEL